MNSFAGLGFFYKGAKNWGNTMHATNDCTCESADPSAVDLIMEARQITIYLIVDYDF